MIIKFEYIKPTYIDNPNVKKNLGSLIKKLLY